jgi:hypothetical protein
MNNGRENYNECYNNKDLQNCVGTFLEETKNSALTERIDFFLNSLTKNTPFVETTPLSLEEKKKKKIS